MLHSKELIAVFVKQGSLHHLDGGTDRTCSVRTVQFEEAVLKQIEDNTSTSTRAIAKELNTSNNNVWNAIHEMNMYPFIFHKVQVPSTDGTILPNCKHA